MTAQGSFFPRRTRQYVPDMQYAADVRKGGTGKIRIPAMLAADPDGIIVSGSIAAAGTTSTFAAALTDAAMGKFGRNVTVVAAAAATSKVWVNGHDYLGQGVTEEFTLAGTTPVVGKKAFKWIDSVKYDATAGGAITVGWGNVLGLPYKLIKLDAEIVSGVTAASAGAAVVGALSTQTGVSGDPRGTYTPHSTNIPDGVKYYDIVGLWDEANLHGNPHYAA